MSDDRPLAGRTVPWTATRLVLPAIVFGGGTGLLAALSLSVLRGWQDWNTVAHLSAIYGVGAAVGMGIALVLAMLLPKPRSRWTRTLLLAVLVVMAMAGATGALVILDYRMYYSQWHAPAFSRIWIWQQVFTSLGALYQYAVMGTRYYGVGVLLLLGATSWWASRSAH